MIKITLGELVIAEQEGALVEIAKLDLKIKDAIKLTKILKKVTEEEFSLKMEEVEFKFLKL